MMKKWFIPDGYWHNESNGVFVSHEAVSVLNINEVPANITLTLYFEDKEKMTGFQVTVGAERTLHIRMDKIKNDKGLSVPANIPYAIVLECDKEITVQYTRVDTSQKELTIATTIV